MCTSIIGIFSYLLYKQIVIPIAYKPWNLRYMKSIKSQLRKGWRRTEGFVLGVAFQLGDFNTTLTQLLALQKVLASYLYYSNTVYITKYICLLVCMQPISLSEWIDWFDWICLVSSANLSGEGCLQKNLDSVPGFSRK